MGPKSFAKKFVVATAMAAAGVSLIVQPASAATTINFESAQGQFDNNPGRGQSWVWVSAGGNNANYSARTEYQFYNGATGSITAYQGQAASKDPGQDIWRIRVCVTRWSGTIAWCSNWS
ncbi:hypothetical protein [Streptosporangium subroseum]|uniref:hypothetical protein n=1 Tax=Streptosporangium subroseum TaxID=106412 RepID=UPI0011805D5D|nr:hypothetical protein [Streptosporangium subroseum]